MTARRGLLAVGVAAALVLTGALGALSACRSTGAPAAAGSPPVDGPPASIPAGLDATTGVPSDAGPPTRLRIPAIGVDAPLERLALDASGALGVPARFSDAGWYAAGTVPGEVGPAVIAGHVDSKTGPAVFFRLSQLHSGDLVEVARGTIWVRFRVVGVERYPKDRFPTARVYGPTPDPQLRLITCGGTFDKARNSYRDNTVVYAVST